MELQQTFDTLIYGKGTVNNGHYSIYCSVKSVGHFDMGYKTKELKERLYFVKYKGETVLVMRETDKGMEWERDVMYDGRKKHDFNKNINRTLNRIIDYMTIPFREYDNKYSKEATK